MSLPLQETSRQQPELASSFAKQLKPINKFFQNKNKIWSLKQRKDNTRD